MNASCTPEYQFVTTGEPTSDLFLMQALREGIQELVQNPYLINYAFMNLLTPPLSVKYGAAELAKIKTFFLSTKIPVIYGDYLLARTPPPLIAVQLASSKESTDLAGFDDENMVTDNEELETVNAKLVYPQPYNLYGPFTPQYNPTTGNMSFSGTNYSTTNFFVGECIQSQNGVLYPVLNITDGFNFTITTNVVDNFTNSTIVSSQPNPSPVYGFHFFDEVYNITAVTSPSVASLFWLTGILRFVMLRIRHRILEKYNVQLSRISIGPPETLETGVDNVQLLAQTFSMTSRSEYRVLRDTAANVRGIILKELNLYSDGQDSSIESPQEVLTEE